MSLYKGEHLKLARIIYGYNSQEELGKVMGVSPATIQRYEAMDSVDFKILGEYTHHLKFDMQKILIFVEQMRAARSKTNVLTLMQ